MRDFEKVGFKGLVTAAAMAVAMSSASANEITPMTGSTASSSAAFLHLAVGTGLGLVVAHDVILPSIGSTPICYGGSMDCAPTTLTGLG